MARVLVFLAEGFEEIEAITIVDVLRRANNEVLLASISKNLEVVSAHGVKVIADVLSEEVVDDNSLESFDMMVLPGGLPGSDYLNESIDVEKAILFQHNKKKYVAAICAAPKVLCAKGIVGGSNITHYPGAVENLNGAKVIESQAVVVDEHIITSRGPGTALAFSYQLVELLNGKALADQLSNGMLSNR